MSQERFRSWDSAKYMAILWYTEKNDCHFFKSKINNFYFWGKKINNCYFFNSEKNKLINQHCFKCVYTSVEFNSASQSLRFMRKKREASRCIGLRFCLSIPKVSFPLLKSLSQMFDVPGINSNETYSASILRFFAKSKSLAKLWFFCDIFNLCVAFKFPEGDLFRHCQLGMLLLNTFHNSVFKILVLNNFSRSWKVMLHVREFWYQAIK